MLIISARTPLKNAQKIRDNTTQMTKNASGSVLSFFGKAIKVTKKQIGVTIHRIER